MSLRDYQVEALNSIVEHYHRGVTKQLVTAPTASGKAVVFAHLPQWLGMSNGEQMILLVHLDTLVFQAAEKIRKYNPSLTVDIEKAQYRADPNADVVVASIQSVGRTRHLSDGSLEYSPRLKKFNPQNFPYILVDESHHATGETYQNVLRYFKVHKGERDDDRSKLLCGFTATAFRGDSIGLELVFDKIVFQKNILDMIRAGWLADVAAYRVYTETDISEVHTQRGDFIERELTATVDTSERNLLIVRKYQEYGEGMSAVAFTSSIQHSHNLADVFQRQGVRAAAVSGKTPEKEKWDLLKRHESGDLTVICSCAVLGEGWDNPRASIALMARPTRSSLRYIQNLGRVLRPCPSPEDLAAIRERGEEPDWIKDKAVVLDFVDVTGRHQVLTTPTLFGLRPSFNLKGKSVTKTLEEVEKLEAEQPSLNLRESDDIEEIRSIVERVDLFQAPTVPEAARRHSRYVWIQQGLDQFRLSLPDRTSLSIKQNHLGQFEIYRSREGQRALIEVAPGVAEAFILADGYVPKDAVATVLSTARWRQDEPTEKQAGALYNLDRGLRREFTSKDELYRFMVNRYLAGDLRYTKGGVSQKISSLVEARS